MKPSERINNIVTWNGFRVFSPNPKDNPDDFIEATIKYLDKYLDETYDKSNQK